MHAQHARCAGQDTGQSTSQQRRGDRVRLQVSIAGYMVKHEVLRKASVGEKMPCGLDCGGFSGGTWETEFSKGCR